MSNKVISEETYKNRPLSLLVIKLMKKSGLTKDEVADALFIDRKYLNNKLSRNSFSFNDIVLVAHACGYEMIFTNPKEKDFFAFQDEKERI